MRRLRLLIFFFVAAAHVLVIYFFAFNVNAASVEHEESARVMKLMDLEEYIPPPPEPPPPPPPREEAPPPDNAVEAIAEEMIETEDPPEDLVEAGSITAPVAPVVSQPAAGPWADYLLPHRLSVNPKFPPDSELLKNLRYPPIARRANIEGRVVLDLFVDRNGVIQRIEVLLEDPPNRGFGEAAREAFNGVRCEPAQANGEQVSSRVRYPVNFRLR